MASIPTGGGWALSATNCPANTTKCDLGSFCCPTGLTCINDGNAIAEVCCPGEDDCVGHFELSPTCADPTLSLWNATNNPDFGFGYFCCLRTQIGLQNGECGLPLLLGPPSTNDAVLVSSTGTTSASASTSVSSSSWRTTISTGTWTGASRSTSLPASTSSTSMTSTTESSSSVRGSPASSSSLSASSTPSAKSDGARNVRIGLSVRFAAQFAFLAIGLALL